MLTSSTTRQRNEFQRRIKFFVVEGVTVARSWLRRDPGYTPPAL